MEWATVPPLALRGCVEGAVVVTLCLVALHLHGVKVPAALRLMPRTARDLRQEAALAFAGFVALAYGFVVSAEVADLTGPQDAPGSPAAVLGFLTDWTAGPVEELFFTLTLVVLGRRAGLSWLGIVAVSAVARVLFHVYYGPGSIGLVVWAAAFVVLYVVTGRVLGLIVIHAWHNTMVGLAELGDGWVTATLITQLAVASLLLHPFVRAVAERLRVVRAQTASQPAPG